MNRTDRLYGLVEELRRAAPRARTARALSERFEVSARTIERDLLALQEAGVPIWATPGPGGGYAVDPTMTMPSLNFTAEEATAIAVALSQSGPIPFGEAARTALRKVVAAMSVTGRSGARDLVERIHVLQRSGEMRRGAVMRAVEEAVRSRQVLRIDYVDGTGVRTAGRLVEPCGLAGNEDHWYLIGWCRLRDGGRTFRLDRVASAEVTLERAPERDLSALAADVADRARHPSLDD